MNFQESYENADSDSEGPGWGRGTGISNQLRALLVCRPHFEEQEFPAALGPISFWPWGERLGQLLGYRGQSRVFEVQRHADECKTQRITIWESTT